MDILQRSGTGRIMLSDWAREVLAERGLLASRGRHATSQPSGEAIQGWRWSRSCRFRHGLWDLHDDRLLKSRCRTLCRSHALLIIPVSLPLRILEKGLIGGHLLADVDAAMKPFQHQESKAGHPPISRALA
ncbi:hypothetical protein [Bradyrhizobium canariense]|uniref:hypothetical protein n=1 Tax=Bradyrhizobium canariense TaxID=255045 RepID=UPI0011BAA92F|nr:hypothetical protein [Bradyrhizobium canariense]